MTTTASPIAFWHDAMTATVLVDAAEAHGLAGALSDARTLAEVSARTGIEPHRLEVLLDALHAVAAVERDGDGRWFATELWSQLGGLRQRFSPRLDDPVGVDAAETSAAFYPAVIAQLGDWHRGSARMAAASVIGGPGCRVLDAGAGSAVWSLAVAERWPDVRVVALDLPAVLPTTQAIVAATGHRAAYSFVAADLFGDRLEDLGFFDLVIAGNLCHLFSSERAGALLAILADRLAPGGTLAIADAVPTGVSDACDRSARLYGVHLLGRSREGRPWTLADYCRWMSDLGLTDITRHCVADDSPMAVVTARRPMDSVQ